MFKADVKPSMRVNDVAHLSWIAVRGNGVVLAGHCDCLAGLGESCSHIAALLFKLEAAVRLAFTSETCTDVPCEWNNYFVKKVPWEPISKINIYSDKFVTNIKAANKKHETFESSDIAMQQQFLNSLHLSDCNSVELSLFKETAAKFVQTKMVPVHQPQLLDLLRNLFNDSNIALTSEELALKCKSLSLTVTSSQVDFLEASTLQQVDNVLWHEHRAGHNTASAAYDALHTNPNQPAIFVLKKIITSKPEPIHAASLEHGRKAEKCVFESYCTAYAAQLNTNVSVSRTGVRICQDEP